MTFHPTFVKAREHDTDLSIDDYLKRDRHLIVTETNAPTEITASLLVQRGILSIDSIRRRRVFIAAAKHYHPILGDVMRRLGVTDEITYVSPQALNGSNNKRVYRDIECDVYIVWSHKANPDNQGTTDLNWTPWIRSGLYVSKSAKTIGSRIRASEYVIICDTSNFINELFHYSKLIDPRWMPTNPDGKRLTSYREIRGVFWPQSDPDARFPGPRVAQIGLMSDWPALELAQFVKDNRDTGESNVMNTRATYCKVAKGSTELFNVSIRYQELSNIFKMRLAAAAIKEVKPILDMQEGQIDVFRQCIVVSRNTMKDMLDTIATANQTGAMSFSVIQELERVCKEGLRTIDEKLTEMPT